MEIKNKFKGQRLHIEWTNLDKPITIMYNFHHTKVLKAGNNNKNVFFFTTYW